MVDRKDYSIIGKRFGRLVVKEFSHKDKGNTYWKCMCDCGNMINVQRSNLGRTVNSCGCLRDDFFTKHGDNRQGKRHPLYVQWLGIRARCYGKTHKAYKWYGGKGIKMIDDWQNYRKFREWALDNGWEVGKHIHRKESTGNYSPENCIILSSDEHMLKHKTRKRDFAINEKTGYYNVYYNKKRNKYIVTIKSGGITYQSQYYDSPHDAAEAYNKLVESNKLARPLNKITR